MPGYLDRPAQEALLAALRDVIASAPGLHAAHAEDRQADVGAHDQLRAARLGHRRDAAIATSRRHPETGEPWPPIPDILL